MALSTTEGEYMAMSDGAKEVIWLKGLAKELGINLDLVKLYFDNQGAGALSVGEGLQRQTKHIDVRHHFIRDCISSGQINISYTPTAEMLADIFTKPLGRVKHALAFKMLGRCWEEGGGVGTTYLHTSVVLYTVVTYSVSSLTQSLL